MFMVIRSLIIVAAITGATLVPGTAIAQPTVNQCNVTVHFIVNSSGNEFINVGGKCAGRVPTATTLARLAAPLVLPPWMTIMPATKAQDRRWHLTGPCDIVRVIKHTGMTVSCRNGQHRIFANPRA